MGIHLSRREKGYVRSCENFSCVAFGKGGFSSATAWRKKKKRKRDCLNREEKMVTIDRDKKHPESFIGHSICVIACCRGKERLNQISGRKEKKSSDEREGWDFLSAKREGKHPWEPALRLPFLSEKKQERLPSLKRSPYTIKREEKTGNCSSRRRLKARSVRRGLSRNQKKNPPPKKDPQPSLFPKNDLNRGRKKRKTACT